jgi:hypothetical protein
VEAWLDVLWPVGLRLVVLVVLVQVGVRLRLRLRVTLTLSRTRTRALSPNLVEHGDVLLRVDHALEQDGDELG